MRWRKPSTSATARASIGASVSTRGVKAASLHPSVDPFVRFLAYMCKHTKFASTALERKTSRNRLRAFLCLLDGCASNPSCELAPTTAAEELAHKRLERVRIGAEQLACTDA